MKYLTTMTEVLRELALRYSVGNTTIALPGASILMTFREFKLCYLMTILDVFINANGVSNNTGNFRAMFYSRIKPNSQERPLLIVTIRMLGPLKTSRKLRIIVALYGLVLWVTTLFDVRLQVKMAKDMYTF